MITLEDWNKNPELAKALREDLEKPHWKAALFILNQRSPAKMLSGIPYANITGHGDALAGKTLGYEQALIGLHNLSLPDSERSAAVQETYGITSQTQATE